jgi:hypothetical protein
MPDQEKIETSLDGTFQIESPSCWTRDVRFCSRDGKTLILFQEDGKFLVDDIEVEDPVMIVACFRDWMKEFSGKC